MTAQDNNSLNNSTSAPLSHIISHTTADSTSKQMLRHKIVIILSLTSIFPLSLIISIILLRPDFAWMSALVGGIALIVSICGIYLVVKAISPIDTILSALQTLLKGQLEQHISLHTGDELQLIADELNLLRQQFQWALQKLNYEKNLANIEKNKLTQAFAALNEGIIILNKNRHVIFANLQAEQVTGWSLAEMINKPIESLIHLSTPIGEEIPPIDYCPIGETQIAGRKEFKDQPLTLIGKAGGRAYILLTSLPVTNHLSDLGCILVLRNITDQKRLESMQLDFVSMASHELRTPLTSIKGYLSVFIDEHKDKLNPEELEFLNRIMISVKQLEGLINNLLSVSKVERGAFSLNIQPLDWAMVLNQVVRDNSIHAKQKNITLTLKLPSTPLPQVFADMIRITEVLNNLLSNAINYTPNGGKIEVSTWVEGSEVVTAVADTGKGIPKDALPHLFTKFFRVEGALDRSSNSKGTGLGLYLSKSIIDLHKGRIWATSPGPNLGSTFYFTLPITRKTSVESELMPLNVSQSVI